MSIRTTKNVQVKIEIPFDGRPKQITIRPPQMKQYLDLKNTAIPDKPDDVFLLMLQDCSTKIIVDGRYQCMGFE